MKTAFSLPDETSISYERSFAAPAERLWEAYTDPGILRTWMLGPHPGTTFAVCEMDVRSGGNYRWVWEHPGGRLEITGEVLEVEAPHLLVTTEVMSDMDVPPSRHEIRFRADGDSTLMTGTITYASREIRDSAYASGMDEGMEVSFDRLEETS